MKELTVTELFDLDETIAGEIFEGITYLGRSCRRSGSLS